MAKEQMLNVRVNPAESNKTDLDEVFITSDTSEKSTDPYVNRVIYAKPGLFRDGSFGSKELAALEREPSRESEGEAAQLTEQPTTVATEGEG